MKLIFVFFMRFYEKLFVLRQRTVHGAFAINKPQVTIKFSYEVNRNGYPSERAFREQCN